MCQVVFGVFIHVIVKTCLVHVLYPVIVLSFIYFFFLSKNIFFAEIH